MKVTVIMPTYNDEKSINETLDSLIVQTYANWELLIVDDGSTDNTKELITQYKKDKDPKNKIKYVYQENQDQLNAINNVLKYVTGDYIYILHSDDLIESEDTLEKCITYMLNNKKLDAIIGDLTIINEKSEITGVQKVRSYKKKKSILALQTLWLGRNLYVDVAFHTKESYIKNVANTYLKWNTPFWIKTNRNSLDILNVEKVPFSFYKYRIHSGNYINNFNGKLNVINGELRTITNLMKYYNIPFYKVQYLIYRIFNKLGIGQVYTPIYNQKQQQNIGEIIKFVLEKRFTTDEIEKNIFLNSIENFFYNIENNNIVELDKIDENEFIYKGSDMRRFNNDLINNNISNIYLKILKAMNNGINTIVVADEEDKLKAEYISKFLCIYPYIKIKLK
ncbi:MAG: glycosyltransferase family 2 protein [Clostridia bacterium]